MDTPVWTQVNKISNHSLFPHFMYLSSCSARILADDLASKKSLLVSSISSWLIWSLPLIFARRLAGVRSWTAYLQQRQAAWSLLVFYKARLWWVFKRKLNQSWHCLMASHQHPRQISENLWRWTPRHLSN